MNEVTKNNDEVTIHFSSTSNRTIVVLNDAILGVTEDKTIVINGIDTSKENVVSLIPLSEDMRGEGVEINLRNSRTNEFDASNSLGEIVIPKAPNTGKAN